MEPQNILLYLGILFLISTGNKILSKKLNIPEVTGYVVIGVLCGQSVFNVFNDQMIENLKHLSSIALGIIAFTIGVELRFSVLKKIGKSIFLIVIFEGFAAFFLVLFSVRYLLHQEMFVALLLAAVSAATAPAATVAVIKQYKSKGQLTSAILAVVGVDDALALIIYVFAASFSMSLMMGTEMHIMTTIVTSVLSILYAIVIGVVAALLFMLLLRKIRSDEIVKMALAAFILLLLGISEHFHVSELLSIMTFGALLTNTSPVVARKSENIIEFFTPVFLAIFFIIGGAHLDVTSISKIGLIGVVYFFARAFGKIGGATLGATLGKAPKNIRKYIGFALLPQVGVALALALAINKDFNQPMYGDKGKEVAVLVINVLLFTTIITEIIGPLLTKKVLMKSGEIKSNDREK
ncbi:MAG: cation:proton antiporter [Candidatus Delongbacteria bacterium]|nr:cation:proton antiporter [Candidatus Delongbacteria bacterium]